MDRRSGLGWLQSWPAITLLLLTLLGIYRRSAPLENGRPIAEREVQKPAASTDGSSSRVNLKLWQDPFDALPLPQSGSRAAEQPTPNTVPKPGDAKTTSADTSDPTLASIAMRIREPYRERTPETATTNRTPQASLPAGTRPPAYDAVTQIFFIPLDDERTPEVREVRIRRRQAVIAALRVSGMVAESSSSMSVLSVSNWKTEPANPRSTKLAKSPAYVACEWFSTDPLLPDSQRRTSTCQCLIVWIPSSAFSDQLLNGIDQVMTMLAGSFASTAEANVAAGTSSLIQQLTDNRLRVTLVGPESSTSLDELLRWTYKKQIQGTQNSPTHKISSLPQSFLTWLNILSPAATYDTVLTLEELRRLPGEHFQNPSTPQQKDKQPIDQRERNKAMLRDDETLFLQAGVNFQRSIGQDSVLASSLIHELELRGINLIPKVNLGSQGERTLDHTNLDEIALVTESNSLYGRAFPVIFAAAMLNHGEVDHVSEMKQRIESFLRAQQAPKNLRNYSYIRQVDGSRSVSLPTPKTDSKSSTQFNLDGFGPYPEAPLGDGQLDYIRRLALQLADEYRHRSVGERRLKAIGIIGSDVYDKLLILQALRQVFPNVIFFTTDLDARLYQSENLPWTRNLLVASHYGLSLANGYQRGLLEADTPAFRDSYQTSYFFTLRYLLGLPFPNHIANSKDEPNQAAEGAAFWRDEDLQSLVTRSRIFEIGREQAIDLTEDRVEVTRAAYLHPSRHQYSTWGSLSQLTLYIFAGLCIGVLCYYTLANPSSGMLLERSADTRSRRLTVHGRWLLLAVATSLVFTTLVLWDNIRSNGEPWSLSSGTSVWPCLALRLIAIYLSVYFSWRILQPNRYLTLMSFMSQELPLRPAAAVKYYKQMKPSNFTSRVILRAYLRHMLARLRDQFAVRQDASKASRKETSGADPVKLAESEEDVSVASCWRQYQRNKHPSLMILRAVALACVMGLAHFALSSFADESHRSYRGSLNHLSFKILTHGSDAFVMFLAFLVVDATRQACMLVRRISSEKSNWPDKIIALYPQHKGSKDAITEVLDMRLVTALTEEVGRQVYLPFITLMFVVVARLGLFDAPSWTPPLVITYAIIVLSMPACTFILRRAATRSRESSLQALRHELEKSRTDKNASDSTTALMKEIEDNKRGAFSPLLDDPFFGAMLLPSGGFTIAGIIETWLV